MDIWRHKAEQSQAVGKMTFSKCSGATENPHGTEVKRLFFHTVHEIQLQVCYASKYKRKTSELLKNSHRRYVHGHKTGKDLLTPQYY
jgi:hypothetical protein